MASVTEQGTALLPAATPSPDALATALLPLAMGGPERAPVERTEGAGQTTGPVLADLHVPPALAARGGSPSAASSAVG